MKKSIFIIAIMIPILFSSLLLITNASATTEWQSYSDIATDKEWTITFNQQIAASSIANNVYIVTTNNKKIAVTATTSGKKLKVKPTTKLNTATSYKLVVTDNLKSTKGKVMNQEIIIPFTTIKSVETTSATSNATVSTAKTFSSEYDLLWKMPSTSYKELHLVGTKSNKTVGGYETRAGKTVFGIKVGGSRDAVKAKYGAPLQAISKNYTKYTQNYTDKYNQETSGTYLINDQYVTFFYDAHKNYKVRSVTWVSVATEMSKPGFFATQSTQLRDGFENLMVELINQARVAEGLKPLTYTPKHNLVARKHSANMADHNFFGHVDLNGLRGGDRMKKGGVKYNWWGENLAYGQYSAIFAHEALMNSLGHRENILREEFTHVFVGVDFNSKNQPYFTMNFYSL